MNVVANHQRIAAPRALKRGVMGTLSATPLVAAILAAGAGSAYAQQAAQAQAQQSQAPAVEEIVVTGTRVVRDGYQAPTPVSVVGVEDMQNIATNNVADYLNTLPNLAGSSTPVSTASLVTTGQGAVNSLNLRGLGSVRTLVLLNGQRTVGSLLTGVVDVNELPQQLISRVDVVTGGASAGYGSDAVTGIVNFILDTKFTGVKGEVSGGVTTYGDDRNWKIGLTAGTGFANDRGHFLISGEMGHEDGILIDNRPFNSQGWGLVTNPAYGTGAGKSTSVPQNILLNQVGLSNATRGGTIASGPLKYIAFGPGGVPYPLALGSIVSDPLMSGGSWRSTTVSDTLGDALTPVQGHQNIFTRMSYQVTDDIEVYGQAAWSHLDSFSDSAPIFYPGNLTIKSDNAFIPASLQPTLLAAGSSFAFGTMNGDLVVQHPTYDRRTLRFVLGGDGKFDAFDTSWKWDAYFADGLNLSTSVSGNTINTLNYQKAIDAVKGPNGTIVCRSTLTDPTNGCIPYNVFGVGVNSQAALNYLIANPYNVARLNQKVLSANVSGEPFSDWAGPVSLAIGIEHRQEKTRSISDPGETASPVPWFLGVPAGYAGSFSVTEDYVETVVPLARDTAWAKQLDLNGAVRETGYSTFGTVTTWKVGATYSPIDDIRFRGVRSRDIREPTLVDLYQAGTSMTNQVTDPFNNNAATQYRSLTTGNPNLHPENADSTDIGVVLQPSFFPRFSLSFDYYNIDISNAITQFGAQSLVNLCFNGSTLACSTFTRNTVNGVPQIAINIYPLNFATEKAKGFDIESSYLLPLGTVVDSWDGNLGFRVRLTHYISDVQDSGLPGSIPLQLAGAINPGAVPKWRYESAINYVLDPISITLTGRGLGAVVYNNANIECTTGCPVSTTNHVTVSNNHIPGAFYLDLSTSYKIHIGDTAETELFFNVRNLANKDANIVGQGPGGTGYDFPATSLTMYDVLGRVFRAGIRFKM
jgi:outer membrane receptor protein involved in Fe transport